MDLTSMQQRRQTRLAFPHPVDGGDTDQHTDDLESLVGNKHVMVSQQNFEELLPLLINMFTATLDVVVRRQASAQQKRSWLQTLRYACSRRRHSSLIRMLTFVVFKNTRCALF